MLFLACARALVADLGIHVFATRPESQEHPWRVILFWIRLHLAHFYRAAARAFDLLLLRLQARRAERALREKLKIDRIDIESVKGTWKTREQMEATERATLAPFCAKIRRVARPKISGAKPRLSNRIPTRPRPDHSFSRAFRRLEYKTQVFLNGTGDHLRTRLTHSIEVASISRTIARALALNEDLAEAIALAHDLGHTPFRGIRVRKCSPNACATMAGSSTTNRACAWWSCWRRVSGFSGIESDVRSARRFAEARTKRWISFARSARSPIWRTRSLITVTISTTRWILKF